MLLPADAVAASSHPDDSLSEWGTREGAGEAGWPVSHRQFDLYVSWGLLPGESDGRWPPETIERLIRIRQEAARARALPRRVLRLRADYHWFPVPTPQVRTAFLEFVPMLRRPVRKFARMDVATRAFGARLQGGRARPRRTPLPLPGEWRGLLGRYPLTHWDSHITGWYAFASRVLPDAVRGTPESIDDIPVEERVVLYALLDISRPGGAPPEISQGEP